MTLRQQSTFLTQETYTYDAYGKPTIRDLNGNVITQSQFGNPFMFTGREYDAETGLYHYRARAYSPTIGRFLQRDPVGYAAGINLYSYCSNNPINFIDPSGLFTLWDVADFYFFGESAVKFAKCANLKTGIDLILNTAGLLPILPSIGIIKKVGEMADAAKITDRIKDVATSFRSGKYREIALQNDVVAFRYFGGKSKAEGSFLTTQQTARMITSPGEAQKVLNLPTGNLADQMGQFIIPKGTKIYMGRVEGGAEKATQIFVDNPGVLRRVE